VPYIYITKNGICICYNTIMYLEIVQNIIHYGMHFVLPGIIAFIFYKNRWKNVYGILLLTMLVDLDHLFANPIFDPERCSIGYHFLHSYSAIAVYVLLIFSKKTRIIGIGLVLHMITDFLDCLW
jgi:hypothetical protein